jgi:hypothetical protein
MTGLDRVRSPIHVYAEITRHSSLPARWLPEARDYYTASNSRYLTTTTRGPNDLQIAGVGLRRALPILSATGCRLNRVSTIVACSMAAPPGGFGICTRASACRRASLSKGASRQTRRARPSPTLERSWGGLFDPSVMLASFRFDHDWRAASAPLGCSPGLAFCRLRTVVQF